MQFEEDRFPVWLREFSTPQAVYRLTSSMYCNCHTITACILFLVLKSYPFNTTLSLSRSLSIQPLFSNISRSFFFNYYQQLGRDEQSQNIILHANKITFNDNSLPKNNLTFNFLFITSILGCFVFNILLQILLLFIVLIVMNDENIAQKYSLNCDVKNDVVVVVDDDDNDVKLIFLCFFLLCSWLFCVVSFLCHSPSIFAHSLLFP